MSLDPDDQVRPRTRTVEPGVNFLAQLKEHGAFEGSDEVWAFVDLLLHSLVEPGEMLLAGTSRRAGRLTVNTSIGELTVYYTIDDDDVLQKQFFEFEDPTV